MARKRGPLPARAEVGPIEELEAALRFQSTIGATTSIDRDLTQAQHMLEWYEALADDLVAGRRVPSGWPPPLAHEVARLIHFHCVLLDGQIERVDDDLAARRRELDELRPLLTGAARRERIARNGRAFVEREDASIRERLEFLEIEQTRIMARDVGAAALLSGLALGSLGARVGADPFIEVAVAFHERQSTFAHHKRGPVVDEKRRRNQKILEWNDELAFYPKGRPRERYERVRLIHERCQKTYHDLRAEAHAARDRAGEAAAAAWNIGVDRIDQLIPRETKKTS